MYIITEWFLHDSDPAGPPERIRVAGVRRADVDGDYDTVLRRLVQHLQFRVALVSVDVHLFDQVVRLVQRNRAAAVVGLGGRSGKTTHRSLIRRTKTLLFQR